MLMESMVAASTAAMDQQTARSRMRPASVSRISGSICLLSFSPRMGRSGESTTAAATTAPNSEPRPTSSTPATALKPRACSSRSRVASQRNLIAGDSGRMVSPLELLAFAQTGGLALETAQIVKFGAAHASGADHIDMVDHFRVDGEDALDALAEADFTDRDGLADAGVIARDESPLKRLQPLLVAFLNLDVDAQGVAGAEIGDLFLTQILLNKLRH